MEPGHEVILGCLYAGRPGMSCAASHLAQTTIARNLSNTLEYKRRISFQKAF